MKDWLRHAPAAALLTLATLAAPVLLELASPRAEADLMLRDAPVVLPVPPPLPPVEPPELTLAPLLDPTPAAVSTEPPAPVVSARLDAPGPPTLAFTAPGLVAADFTAETPVLAPGPVLFEMAQVDVPPRPLAQPAPVYPTGASLRRIEGAVVVEFDIGLDGRVEDARVISATPSGWFEGAALAAVKQWRFVPAQSGGKDVRVRARQKLTFAL